MALDSNLAARWVWTVLNGDATLTTLLGANRIFRRVGSRGGGALVVVEVASTGERTGAIMTGPNTHTGTNVTVRTSVWDLENVSLIEQVVARIDQLLDGQVNQSFGGGGGTVYSCMRGTDIPRSVQEGDVGYIGWDVLWYIVAKG